MSDSHKGMFMPSDTATISASVLDFVAVFCTFDAVANIPVPNVIHMPVVDLFSSRLQYAASTDTVTVGGGGWSILV